MLPAAVIFDMDGLLADTEPLHGDCFLAAFSRFGIEATLQEYLRVVTLGGSTVRDFYLSLGGDPSTFEAVKKIKDKGLEAAVRETGMLLPGVLELLARLKAEGIPTAVATSARRRSMSIILDRFGLWPCFDTFVTKDDVAAEKPDPAALVAAAANLSVGPAACVVLEDSPRGVLAAFRAGMKCIAVPTTSTADGDFSLATLVVNSLEEVDVAVLSRLFDAPRNGVV